MGLKLIPREEKFFDLFNQQAANVLEGVLFWPALAHPTACSIAGRLNGSLRAPSARCQELAGVLGPYAESYIF